MQSEQRGSFEQPPLHGAGHSNNYFHGHMENYSDKNLLNKKFLKQCFSPLPPCVAIQFRPTGSLPASTQASGQRMCTCAHALPLRQVHGTACRAARPPPAVPVWGTAHAQEWDKAPRPAAPHTGIITTLSRPGHGHADRPWPWPS